MIVFMYGPLLKGLKRWSIPAHCNYLGPAMIRAELFDIGSFPGIKVSGKQAICANIAHREDDEGCPVVAYKL